MASPPRRRRLLFGRLRQWTTDNYLFVPLLCVAISVGAAFGLEQLDHTLKRSNVSFAFGGGAESARSILSSIASSMMTFTGLVFSITIVALQLTSSQYSPRALRNFLNDRITQFSLGVFLATFAFSLLMLRAVRSESALNGEFIPGVSITVAVVLVGLSLVMFVVYIHHMAQAIRATSIIQRIARDTRDAIGRMQDDADGDGRDEQPASHRDPSACGGSVGPGPIGDGQPHDLRRPPGLDEGRVITSTRAGILADADVVGLVLAARDRACLLQLIPQVGAFVPRHAPLFVAHPFRRDGDGTDGRSDEGDDDVRRLVSLATERSMRQDAAFGFRQLVDIAERALSPGTNDPTTAMECLDQVHDLLRRAAERPLPDGRYCDDDGDLRLLMQPWTWPDLVRLGLEEIRHWGSSSLQVRRRLDAVIDDLLTVVHDDADLLALHEQRRLLLERVVAVRASDGPG
jgi:uncharacterized membrane protein